ncbi:CPBP family intramembrane metalloprotease [Sporosarcina sp. Marseille-Q4063]|uniref:CPBP family intramembrane glutamic endopeptidase n=1 Tax=Sporosarcina sp. Marseille-Q4063 TaxID=2810514 RepID=UPI001BAF8681|nr:CPBP family intramembrane glutamic endopeptidase [Sporosarcina sp. Marseille-Q4063]QUW21452.1 CPBP family intramembrane metalloprotease [Sporosarcina sp. Marseille-Q4063]
MFKNESGQIRAGWLVLLAFVALIIVQQLFSLPGTLLLIFAEAPSLINGETGTADIVTALDTHPWIFLLMQGGGSVGGILITYLLWRFINKGTIKQLGFRGSLKDLWFGLFLGAISITVIFIVLLATGNVTLVNPLSSPQFSVYTISFLILFILVGFSEEMFFRGYVMSTMASRGNKKWVVYVASALIFSIAHGLNPNVSILGLINIAVVGILFAYMFYATNSLWLPIGYHIMWNYFQGNVFGFAVSGTAPNGIYSVETVAGRDWLTGGAFGLEGGLMATVLILVGFVATRVYCKLRDYDQEKSL